MSAQRGWLRLPAAALLAGLASGACRSVTACAPPVPPVVLGSWTYTATETGASPLSGVLAVTSQCGQEFGGTLDVTQLDAQGQPQRFTGVVSGVLVPVADTVRVDFDAFLDPSARRHLGTVRSDSMSGGWVEQSASGTRSGSFMSVWTSAP